MESNIGTGTVKLYYDNAYLRAFEARVISCEPEKDLFAIALDRTAFFPEEGGQSPDRGVLRTADGRSLDVVDVQIRGGIIYHYIKEEIVEDETVTGELDFEYRFSNMQQHSAEHLFSGIVHRRFGFENVGFHLSDREVTMDYSGVISDEEIAEVETEVNRLIQKNIESAQWFPTVDELPNIEFRSKKEISGQIRLIVYPGVDICACCAPHVAKTGEIGLLKVISVQNYKGGVRVRILAGMRAFAYVRSVYDAMMDTARYMTTSYEEVRGRVEALKTEVIETARRLGAAEASLLVSRAMAAPPEEKKVLLFTEGQDGAALRKAISGILTERGGISAIFNGSDEEGYQYILAAEDGVTDLQKSLGTLGARGGGRPPVVQGQIRTERAKIEAWFAGIETI